MATRTKKKKKKKAKSSITNEWDDDKPVVRIGKSEGKDVLIVEGKFGSSLLNLRRMIWLRRSIPPPSTES